MSASYLELLSLVKEQQRALQKRQAEISSTEASSSPGQHGVRVPRSKSLVQQPCALSRRPWLSQSLGPMPAGRAAHPNWSTQPGQRDTATTPAPHPTTLLSLPEELLLLISTHLSVQDMANWLSCVRPLRPLQRSPNLAASWAWTQQATACPSHIKGVLERSTSPAAVVAMLKRLALVSQGQGQGLAGGCAGGLWRAHQEALTQRLAQAGPEQEPQCGACSAGAQAATTTFLAAQSGAPSSSNPATQSGAPSTSSGTHSVASEASEWSPSSSSGGSSGDTSAPSDRPSPRTTTGPALTGALHIILFVALWAAKTSCADTLRWALCMGPVGLHEAHGSHGPVPCEGYAYVLNQALLAATAHGRLSAMELLLDQGADVHAEHDRALRWACIVGRPDVVELLLRHGANVHALGGFSMQVANQHAHQSVLQLLKEHGAGQMMLKTPS